VYRINLYPAGLEKRARRAAGVRTTAMLALLAGANLLFLGLFAMAGMTLKARADDTETRLEQARARLAPDPAEATTRAAVNQARVLLERRVQRIVWTPALTDLRRLLPNDVILERFEAMEGRGRGHDTFAGMQFNGRLRSGRNVDPVVACLDRLSSSPAYRASFESARLDRVDNSQEVTRFTIACPILRPASTDSTGEEFGG
jgi:Tfp pilus assembly protein PilN